MIALVKGPKPATLAQESNTWKKELLALIASKSEIPEGLYNAYNQTDVKLALVQECHSKCMYCESDIDHITHAHIEHYRPKKKDMFPELTFEWSNLGLACPKCNLNKKDHFDSALPFVNPYVDNPREFFMEAFTLVWPLPGNKRAELTEQLLQLNRPELIEKRRERVDHLNSLIRSHNLETVQALKEAFRQEIEKAVMNDKEYSFLLNAHLSRCGLN